MTQQEISAEVLIADHEEASRNLLREMLDGAGCAVIEAKDGIEAVEKFLGNCPDFVFLDGSLPGMDGLEVCRSIRQADGGEHVPIVMLVGGESEDLIVRALEEGVTDFLSKPLCGTVFGFRVRALLRASQVARELRRRRDRICLAVEISGLGDYEWNISENLWDFSEESRRIFGFEETEGQPLISLSQVVHPEERTDVEEALFRALRGEQVFDVEHRILRPSGEIRQVYHRAKIFWDQAGEPLRLAGTVQDVTDRHRLEPGLRQDEAQLNYLAFHDPLTGLPNRLLFQDRFQHAVAKARRSGGQLAVLFIDLDEFKRINDSLGHDIGDQLLQKVAERIRSDVREEDTLARFGGDEFLLLFENLIQIGTVRIVANKILSSLEKPFEIGGFQLYVAASIGISLYPGNGESMEELLRCADIAMYGSKKIGRNTLQFYTPDLNIRAQEAQQLENALRPALARKELEIYYLPQFDLVSGRIIGTEALLRWHHPERGLLPAAEFLPLAEGTGLIFAISDWILQTICRQSKVWQQSGFPPLTMAVNIAPRMFQQRELPQMVERALRQSGLAPCFLELEVTERMIMANVEAASQTLEKLSRLGVTLAIDDFGTGYSSMCGLQGMPIKKLKIDRAFVNDLNRNPNNAAIAASVIALAQSMNFGVIAEGVETEEQLRFLKTKGCLQGQGFLFSLPLPEARFRDLLARSCTE